MKEVTAEKAREGWGEIRNANEVPSKQVRKAGTAQHEAGKGQTPAHSLDSYLKLIRLHTLK